MLGFFTNLSLMEFQVRYFALFCLSQQYKASSYSGWESFQEYPVNAGVLQGSILGPTLFLLCINDFPDDVICNIDIYADDTALL